MKKVVIQVNLLRPLVAKRGPTRNITLRRKRSANETISIVLDVEAKRIVGVDSQFFISESGCVVQKFGRHNVSKWAKMDENNRENIYNAAMKTSERNKKNRAHSENKTFCGTKSLARVAEEKRRTEVIEVSLIDLYQYGHFSRKTSTWGSEKAKETLVGYRGHVSTSKQIEYDVQRYKQRVDEVEKKANQAEKKACDAEKKADELAKKADEAEKRFSQMNDEIIMLKEK
ncbi:Major outer membrane lipoprotein Oprl [Dillenia turbinata]|uniref:Major outer membrane lipoprotein Oprl n=1 Tax=Dillenia turbinata TaxID=194707 RepID=A0AAN8ZRD8_9MAGN